MGASLISSQSVGVYLVKTQMTVMFTPLGEVPLLSVEMLSSKLWPGMAINSLLSIPGQRVISTPSGEVVPFSVEMLSSGPLPGMAINTLAGDELEARGLRGTILRCTTVTTTCLSF